jgi:hypothetical protein
MAGFQVPDLLGSAFEVRRPDTAIRVQEEQGHRGPAVPDREHRARVQGRVIDLEFPLLREDHLAEPPLRQPTRISWTSGQSFMPKS